MNNTTKYIDRIKQSGSSAEAIIQVNADMLEEALSGNDISGSGSAFAFLLESSATNVAASINKNESITRRLYAKLAVTDDDLMYHLSDRDHYPISSNPAEATVKLLLDRDTLFNKIRSKGVDNKTYIPSDTTFSVNGFDLGIHYPIELSVNFSNTGSLDNYLSGKLTARFVSEGTPSPLQTLDNTLLKTELSSISGRIYVSIEIPVEQFKISSSSTVIDTNLKFRKRISHDDKFMFVRVYGDDGENWVELNTSRSILNYDISEPTVIYMVLEGGQVELDLPDIYNNGQFRNLRADVYTTKGPLDIDLTQVSPNNFSVEYRTLDSYDNRSAYIPVEQVSDRIIFGSSYLTGGKLAMTTEEIRDRIIKRSDSTLPPLRSSDLVLKLGELGYKFSKFRDNITDKVFLASKSLPSRFNGDSEIKIKSSIVDCVIDPAKSDIEEFLIHNGLRSTLRSRTLFETELGITRILNETQVAEIDNNPLLLNDRKVSYNPFYYVVDNEFALTRIRAYDLDNPSITNRSFIDVNGNEQAPFSITTVESTIALTDQGYVLRIKPDLSKVKIDEQDVYITCMIAKLDHVDNIEGSIIQTAIEDDQTFEFILPTNFDIDSTDNLNIEFDSKEVLTKLVDKITVLYGVPASRLPNVGNITSAVRMPSTYITFNSEEISLRYGTSLNGLFKPFKVIDSVEVEYLRHETDIPLTYTETHYEVNPTTGARKYNIVNNDIVYIPVVGMEEGDPVMDGANPVYKHRVGDVVLDGEGDPIVLSQGERAINLGVLLVDGIYLYGNSTNVSDYMSGIGSQLIDNVKEVEQLDGSMDENSVLKFTPKGSINSVVVSLGDGNTDVLDPDLELVVTIYISSLGYNDSATTTIIRNSVRTIVNQALDSDYISTQEIANAVRDGNVNDIRNVSVSGIGINKDINFARLQDESSSFNLKEVIEETNNGRWDVKDSLTIRFVEDI